MQPEISNTGGDSDKYEDIEPRIDPDSKERMAEEVTEEAHPATRFDAGTGQGTVFKEPRNSGLQERPILDGSTLSRATEATVPNPYRGQSDPATVGRQPALNNTSTDRWFISAIIATIIMTVALLLIAQWNPVLCVSGALIAALGLIAMLIVRMSSIGLKRRLRIDAVIMAIIWLVPAAIFIFVLLTSAEQISGGAN